LTNREAGSDDRIGDMVIVVRVVVLVASLGGPGSG
jgi:hypothetical protein